MLFDLQIDTIESWIRDRGFHSVALQLPEGLKIRATEISDRLSEDLGIDVFILGYPCYGACDLFTGYRDYAEALIHFGHSPIPNLPQDENVLYIEARANVEVDDALKAHIDEIPQKVGLLASVQYVHLLPKAKSLLESAGKTVFIGTGDSRICYPGQVLGCNCSSALAVNDNVDGYLFLGEGDFHPLAVAFGAPRKLLILNPITRELRNLDDKRDRMLRKRFAAICVAQDARKFLVIVCGKIGQRRSEAADAIIAKLKAARKTVYRLVTDEINPAALISYQVDAYVNTACPRIAMDDSVRYEHPMLTIPEAEIVLGLRTWEDYVFDSI